MQKFRKEIIFKVIIVLSILILPFSLSFSDGATNPEKISSDLRYYQINTCSISLFEFISANPNVIYQDHYIIKHNNYSSIKCFGKITGVDQIGYTFYISIGTNPLISLLLQSSIWLVLLTFIRKTEKFEIRFKDLLPVALTSLLLVVGIYSQTRFYEKYFYLIDLTKFTSYLNLFIYIFYSVFFLYIVVSTRRQSLINYFPYIILVMGLLNGFNFYFFSIIFLIFGFKSIFTYKKSFLIIFFLMIFWILRIEENNYYLKPDKIRGLTSTTYSINSIIFWTLFSTFLIFGLIYFFKDYSAFINLELFGINLLISLFLVLLLGYFSSSMPLINFLSYFFLGLTKYGTTNSSLFSRNEWNEVIAWRGIYPSAESIGEFFGLALLLMFIFNLEKKKFKTFDLFLTIVMSLGLYLSNNRAAFVMLLLLTILKIINKNHYSKKTKILFYIFSSLVMLPLVGLGKIRYSILAASNSILDSANLYALDYDFSSSLSYLNENESSILYFFVKVLSVFAFYTNRSELWGIFISRYNPELPELFFGTGPYHLSNYYNEIQINQTSSFLLPHSSFLSLLLFFGIVGISLFTVFIYKNLIITKRLNYSMFLINLFILINAIKSDSIFYFPNLIIYITLLSLNIKNFSKSKN